MMPNHSPKVNKQLLEKVFFSKIFDFLMASKWPVMIPKHIPNMAKQFWKKIKIDFFWTICHHNISCLIITCLILSYNIIWYHMTSYDVLWYHMISYDVIWYHMIAAADAAAETCSTNGKPKLVHIFWLWKK